MRTRLVWLPLHVCVIALSIAAPAIADKFELDARRLEADALLRRAADLAERDLYLEAAEIYLAVERDFDDFIDAASLCQVLENAAFSLSEANLIGRAIETRERLLEQYPSCELAMGALYRTARDYEMLAMFTEAAERLVEYAVRSPHAPDAPGAVLEALVLFLGVGDDVSAQLCLPLYEKLIRKVSQHDAATAVFDALELLVEVGDIDFVRSQYGRFIKRYNRVAPTDVVILAHVRLADAWLAGTSPNSVKALRHYRKAVLVHEAKVRDGNGDRAMRKPLLEAVAKAKYQIAMVAFRRLTALRPPVLVLRGRLTSAIGKWWADQERQPEVEPEEVEIRYWLAHVFDPWYRAKQVLADKAIRQFEGVVRLGGGELEIAALARMADARIELAEAMEQAELQVSLKAESRVVRIFRSAVGERVESLIRAAVVDLDHCLERAIDSRTFGTDTRHCEQSLAELRPGDHPLLAEIKPTIEIDALRPVAPGPILESQPADSGKQLILLTVGPKTINTLDPLGGLERSLEKEYSNP